MPGFPTSASGSCRGARSRDPLRRARARGSSDSPSWIRRSINSRVKVFENQRGYDEVTHVLTHAYNLFLGGSCIEDTRKMQTDEGIRRIIGADTIPDPTLER